MSEQDFVYGVFESSEPAAALIEALHRAGFDSEAINLVGPQSDQFRYVSAKIKNPAKDYFVRFGIAGALGGLWAGTMLAPTIPYVVSFQILTSLMGAISGAIVLAYFGSFIATFLTANDPQYYANVYEADTAAGAVIVSVEAGSATERNAAQKILEGFEPIELVVRRALVGPVIGLEKDSDQRAIQAVQSSQSAPQETREKVLSAVA